MKKKTSNFKSQKSKVKNQKTTNGLASSKVKSSTLKAVKESTVVYRSNNNRNLLHYTDEKLGKMEIVKDFLPTPDELVLKDSTVKVTLNLSKSSVDFFKALAQKNKSQYQKVIRNLLDSYSSKYVKK